MLIGIYHGFFAKGRKTLDEYLLGGKTISTIPATISLIASMLSGISLLAIPPDVYLHGINFFCLIISKTIACILVIYLYLPTIIQLETPNGFEYLKMRFNKQIQTFASVIFILQITLYNPAIAYLPAVAFSEVSGSNVHLVTSLICIICIFYTTVGGFKAVIWTDVVQFGGMVISTAMTMYFVINSVEDFNTIWAKARDGQRVDFNFTLDPTIKDGFWPITIGACGLWIYNFSVNPATVQKYLSISDRNKVKWACGIYSIGVITFNIIYGIIGFVLYTIYKGCDPLSSGQIKHSDQLLPYFIVDVANNIPMVKGVFMVGIFSAALSTLSSCFNCLGATIYGDLVRPHISRTTPENYVIKFIIVISGLLCLIVTFLIDKVGSIITYISATQGCMAGCISDYFLWGAMWGISSSFVISATITIGHEWYKVKGAFNNFIKPLSVDNCTFNFNFTIPKSVTDMNEPFILFRISYWYFPFISASLVIIIGLIVSWCTKSDNHSVDPKLISPGLNCSTMFSATDYIVFCTMLAISILIGIYHGFFAKNQKTTNEYLLGGKTISSIPVATSLIASVLSGIALLSIPPDVYLHGINFFCITISIAIASILVFYLYLPTIIQMETPNGFEYLKIRFNKQIQMFASFIFIFHVIIYNSTVAYMPAVALSEVSESNVHLVTSLICIICIFYTTVGGFKAVIWTDVVQFGGMIISTITLLYLLITSVEDFKTLWSKGRDGQRTDINFTLDPTIKDGFWPITIGSCPLWIYNLSVSPASIQKYLSISDRNKVKWTCITYSIGVITFNIVYGIIGFVLYTIYKECDPLSSGQIKHSDQLLPYFIVDVANNIPIVKGVFTVGVFSAALTTLSSSFNCLGATIYGDFVRPHIPQLISKNYIIKFIVVVSGLPCLLLTFLVDKIGNIFTFISATQGSATGCIVGLFSLGMLFPSSNSKGAMWGISSSFVISTTITIGHEWYKIKGAFNYFIKPLSVNNCTLHFNFTTPESVTDVNEPFVLFRISSWYFSFISSSLVIIIGLIVSWCTRSDNHSVDPKLISPVIYSLLKKFKTNPDQMNTHNNVEMTTYKFNKY
ncbi:hypothetical protein FQR65_LT02348 [Abscondita terminalis]|nr:hypothetical protein FQR65_LT02348 [Abscondita terminalis]